jgi:hypothetical protein
VYSRGENMAFVDKNAEYYLIHSMGLTKKQIKDMTLTEIEEHNKKKIRKWLDEQNVFQGTIKKS